MERDTIVCNCRSVTMGMIQDAVEDGADSLEEVQAITGAGTVCGACIGDVKQLVEELTAEKDS